jgi:hypothetical protein
MKLINDIQLDDLSDDQLAAAEAEASRGQALEKLMERFGAVSSKSWLARNHGLRMSAEKGSYLFNIVSALAGLYGARILFQMIPVPIPYLDWVLAIAFLYYLEKNKRKLSDKFWDTWFSTKKVAWGYAIGNFGLLGISLALSVFGVYFAAKDFAPEAKYIGGSDNPEVVALQDQLRTTQDELTALLDDPSSYNSKGQFYYKLMDSRTAKEKQIADLTAILKDKHGVINIQNEDVLSDWKLRNAFRGKFSVFITLLSELLFEICMAFRSYYDYRYCRALLSRMKQEEEEPEGSRKRPGGKKLNGHGQEEPGKHSALEVA